MQCRECLHWTNHSIEGLCPECHLKRENFLLRARIKELEDRLSDWQAGCAALDNRWDELKRLVEEERDLTMVQSLAAKKGYNCALRLMAKLEKQHG
jgi:hypothetical protein